jgi:hypothetical protein
MGSIGEPANIRPVGAGVPETLLTAGRSSSGGPGQRVGSSGGGVT